MIAFLRPLPGVPNCPRTNRPESRMTDLLFCVGVHDRRRKRQFAKCTRWRTPKQFRPCSRMLRSDTPAQVGETCVDPPEAVRSDGRPLQRSGRSGNSSRAINLPKARTGRRRPHGLYRGGMQRGLHISESSCVLRESSFRDDPGQETCRGAPGIQDCLGRQGRTSNLGCRLP